MKKIRNAIAFLLMLLLLAASLPVSAEENGPEIDFLSYEEALTYFDFTTAVERWCSNFGMNVATRAEDAKAAILAGTSRELIIRLATFTRDVGYGDEKLLVNNAFRPASYQEVIGLHDYNNNTGYFYNALRWNGQSVPYFWWKAEESEGWPEKYTIDFSRYDLDTLNMSYAFRLGLRLWDNTWAGGYYARPGCSGHNSGEAMDIQNWWIGANYAVSYTNPSTGVVYNMADYGLYKPLQPSATSAGETWHITCAATVEGMGNFDTALNAGAEPVWASYYNPSLRGGSMVNGRGCYIGAGVMCLQLRLCQLGLLDAKYITGYFCSVTEAAAKEFQSRNGLDTDGICGSGTMAVLMQEEPASAPDGNAPEMKSIALASQNKSSFTLSLGASDDTAVAAYKVETRLKDTDTWLPRYYNAFADGSGETEVDVWRQGVYDVRVTAIDCGGIESAPLAGESIFADMTAPSIRSLVISDISPEGFTLACEGTDDTGVDVWTLTVKPEGGEEEVFSFAHEQKTDVYTYASAQTKPCTVAVSCADTLGNERSFSFRWQFDPAKAALYGGVSICHYEN